MFAFLLRHLPSVLGGPFRAPWWQQLCPGSRHGSGAVERNGNVNARRRGGSWTDEPLIGVALRPPEKRGRPSLLVLALALALALCVVPPGPTPSRPATPCANCRAARDHSPSAASSLDLP
ncbi:hypothetical protein R5R35_000817 [Gryllus longicercus]|uniref:Uncharacterized protein n=1 Tax=Gryllus longicercus TaxID=2509291 RepID=A0AAN9ZBW9_9ORTH